MSANQAPADDTWLVSEATLARTDGQLEPPTAVRLRAAVISLVVSTALLGLKYLAYELTGSTAILSDALESIVNVVAALFSLGGLVVAGWPADRNHPYGHGKIEFFSAAFEGGLIAFAAVLILKEAGTALLFGHTLHQLNIGVLITVGAGFVNAALGAYLLQVGRRYHSPALIADGMHVMADFRTTLAATVGLGLVLFTGQSWLDPLVAALVGVNLIWTGLGLVRHAAGGLLDEEDTELLQRVVHGINANLVPGVVRVHFLRAIRSGRVTHVDAHLVVPEFWTVEQAHEFADAFERRVVRTLDLDGEIAFRIVPCHRQHCAACDMTPCPIRLAPCIARAPVTLEDAVRPD